MATQDRIQELKQKIEQTKKEIDYYQSLQLAVKLVLNGTFGAFANPYFCLTNMNIAGGITAMGRNLIQYMEKCNDYYWYKKWHLDTELHNMLGVKNVKPIDPAWIYAGTKEIVENPTTKQIEEGEVVRKNNVSAYADTDSLFLSFKPVIESCGWQGDPKEFIFLINKHRLAEYFKYRLEQYAEKYHVENIQDFELERINKSVLFKKQKHYIQHVVWEDGIDYEELSYLYPKGVKLVQSGTPPFARTKVKEIVKYLFRHPESYTIKDLLDFVKDIKRQFKMAEIDEISQTSSCSNYDEMVVSDKKSLEFKLGTHYLVKCAAFHNYLLNQHPDLKSRYSFIRSGNKFKFYCCEHPLSKYFGYIRGEYPNEFAPPCDYDTQFDKTVLSQVNELIEALGLPALKKRLSVVFDLFESVK